jgi:uncharacterized protein (DUF4415 family)
MADKPRSKTQEQAHTELMITLREQEIWLEDQALRQKLIPDEWRQMGRIAPVRPVKKSYTLRLDEDVMKWFRGLGRGYQGRINAVLRTYMLALQSKEIEGALDRNWKGDQI